MRADNTHHVIAAASRRSQATRRRAVAALRRMDAAGTPITFDALAREARVSRSWLYTQPDLRTEVERLRQPRHPTPRRVVPTAQRATDTSLRLRLELATDRVRQLETHNKQLRQALAEALGDRRADTSRAPRRDTPKQRVPPPISQRRTATSRTASRTQTRTPEP
jgi:Family of unknown function (DUF6262)